MHQPELFDLPPGVAARVPKVRKAPVSERARYTVARPRHRTLCDDCTQLIHMLGFGVAPPPRAVRWRRRADDGTTVLLCDIHRTERQEAAG